MKRAPVVLAATAAGLAATLGFHAQPKLSATRPATTVTASAPAAKTSKASSSAKTATGDAISTR
jgi:hypothetical protein